VIEVGLIVLAYLLGSIPTAYVVARVIKKIDIREYGTGNVGAANFVTHVGKRMGFALGLFDGLVKGTLPIIFAKFLGLGLDTQIWIAVAAVVGHNWSPYIRFTGGRGISTTLGIYIGFGLWPQIAVGFILSVIIGRGLFHSLAIWTIIAMITVAIMTFILGYPPNLVYLMFGLIGLTLTKRVLANWQRPIKGHPIAKVLLCRLLHDRDVPNREEWVGRGPKHDHED